MRVLAARRSRRKVSNADDYLDPLHARDVRFHELGRLQGDGRSDEV